MPDRATQRERSFPSSPGRDAGAVKDSCQLARLVSRGIQLLSRGPGGVSDSEHERSLGPPWRAKRQGSASMPAGEDGHRSQRRSRRDSASHSQRMSGADPCIAPGTGVSERVEHHRRSGRRRSARPRTIACSGCSGSEQEADSYDTGDQ
jgi:hypothetical protein